MITNINNIIQNTGYPAFRGNNGKTRPTFFGYGTPQIAPFGLYSDRFERQNTGTKKAGAKQTPAKKPKTTNPFRKISYNKAKNMVTTDNMEKVQGFIRQNIDKLKSSLPADQNPVIEGMFEIDGKKYDAQYSGGGGTKNAFQIRHNGEKYVVALPTYVDAPYIAGTKWLDVLDFEPKNTKLLRDEGFRTNDIFDIIPVKVAGVEFPAVLMKPYSEHSFRVGDRKNYSFENLLSFDEINTLNDNMFFDLYGDIPKEIAKLVALGIEPHYDCVNLCRDKKPGSKDCTGNFHLYLNDLDKKFTREKLSEEDARKDIETYTYLVISALPETVDRNMRQWCDYFVFIESNNHIQEEIEARAFKEYKKLAKKG